MRAEIQGREIKKQQIQGPLTVVVGGHYVHPCFGNYVFDNQEENTMFRKPSNLIQTFINKP